MMNRIFALAGILNLVLLFSGCEEAIGGFEEYVGVNLLEYNSGAAVHDFVSGDWILTDGTYVALADRSGTLPVDTAGLPSTADVSNLEIPNLAANGDFNGGTAGWATEAGTTALIHTGVNAIDTDTLQFSITNQLNQINFDLSALADGLVAQASYRFLFSFRGTAITVFEVNDTVSAYRSWNTNADGLGNLYAFPYDISSYSVVVNENTNTPTFSIGSVDSDIRSVQSEGYLDNFRVVRTDVPSASGLPSAIYYEVLLDETGRAPLVSGTYRFSVWIREEETLGANEFHPNGVTLRINDLTTNGAGANASFNRDAGWAAWQKISATLSIDIESSYIATDPILRLSVMPTVYNDQDCGIMFIAQPTLSLIP